VWGASQQQVRKVYASLGAFTVNLVLYSAVEVWAWGRDEEALVDRTAAVVPGIPRSVVRRTPTSGRLCNGSSSAKKSVRLPGVAWSRRSFRSGLIACSIWPPDYKNVQESTVIYIVNLVGFSRSHALRGNAYLRRSSTLAASASTESPIRKVVLNRPPKTNGLPYKMRTGK
jgi:hypothetical protein